jgi:hypothetical protein
MRTKTLPLLIVGILITIIHFSCKKGTVYPPGTATVKYVVTTSSPCRPQYSSIAWTTADSGKAVNLANFSGGNWSTTVVVNTNKGNWTTGSPLIRMWLLGQFSFLKPSTVDAKIYVNGTLVEHQNIPAHSQDSTYYTGMQLEWTTQASNPE